MAGIKDNNSLNEHNILLAVGVRDLCLTTGGRQMSKSEVEEAFSAWDPRLREYAIDKALIFPDGSIAIVDAKQVADSGNFTVSLFIRESWGTLSTYGYDVWVCLGDGSLALASEIVPPRARKFIRDTRESSFWLCKAGFDRKWKRPESE